MNTGLEPRGIVRTDGASSGNWDGVSDEPNELLYLCEFRKLRNTSDYQPKFLRTRELPMTDGCRLPSSSRRIENFLRV